MLMASFVVYSAEKIIGAKSSVLVLSSDDADYYPWALTGLTANNSLEESLPLNQLVSVCVKL